MKRAITALAVLVALASAGATGVAAADDADTIGATVQSRVYMDQDGAMVLVNRSTIPATFTFDVPEGWAIDPPSVTLQPDAHATVSVTGDGPDGAAIGVHVGSTALLAPGEQRTDLLLTSYVYHETPFSWGGFVATILPWVAGVLLIGWLLWRLKPWQIRISRRTV